jgi:hypothetical protein
VSAVSSLSSRGAGLYSAVLVGTQLWLLWPYGALYRDTQACSAGTRFADGWWLELEGVTTGDPSYNLQSMFRGSK